MKGCSVTLTAPMRNASDPEYAAWVDTIGDGEITGDDVMLPLIEPINSVEECLDYLFPTDELLDPGTLISRAFLSPLNVHVDAFNDTVLDRMLGEDKFYHSADSIKRTMIVRVQLGVKIF